MSLRTSPQTGVAIPRTFRELANNALVLPHQCVILMAPSRIGCDLIRPPGTFPSQGKAGRTDCHTSVSYIKV